MTEGDAADPVEPVPVRDPVQLAVSLTRRAEQYDREASALRGAAAELLRDIRAARTGAAECRAWAANLLAQHRQHSGGSRRRRPAPAPSAVTPRTIAAAAARTRVEDVAPAGGRPAPGNSRWDRARRAGVPYATQQALDDLARRAPELLASVADGELELGVAVAAMRRAKREPREAAGEAAAQVAAGTLSTHREHVTP